MNSPKDQFVEFKKREMAYLFYRKKVCRCITNQVMVMQKLMCDLPGSNQRYGEYRSYLDSLNKVWSKLKEKETNLFDQMITFGLKADDIGSVMRYAETNPVDEYAVFDIYGITPGEIEENNRKIKSITLW